MNGTAIANLRARQIDHALATKQGVPVEIEGSDPPLTLYVRQHGGVNRRSDYVAAELSRELIPEDAPGPERFEAIVAVEIEVCARELVAGWDGAVDDQGNPIDCTPDAVRDLLTTFPDVLARVLETAQDPRRFRLSADLKSDPGGR